MTFFEMKRLNNNQVIDHLGWLNHDDEALPELISALMVAFDRIDTLKDHANKRSVVEPGPIQRFTRWLRRIFKDDIDDETPSDWQIRQW